MGNFLFLASPRCEFLLQVESSRFSVCFSDSCRLLVPTATVRVTSSNPKSRTLNFKRLPHDPPEIRDFSVRG
jgi:hypothetical protein